VHHATLVETAVFDGAGVTVTGEGSGGRFATRARFLVDASGREAFLGMRHGERRPMPGLGKVAIYAYFRGARRWPGREEGNVRIYIFPEGWFWWIPLARDETSVGCVLHARTVRARKGSPAELFAEMIERCTAVHDGLVGAERVTPILTAANFSYAVEPVIGDRFLCVGDAVAFVDPIFSAGVFLALVSGEQAGNEILAAFRDGRFRAQRFRGYQRRLERGMRPFTHFIREFYDRGFLRVFLRPQDTLGLPIVDAVTFVLAGGTFSKVPLKMRLSLWIFYRVVRMTRKVLRRRGESAESRLDW